MYVRYTDCNLGKYAPYSRTNKFESLFVMTVYPACNKFVFMLSALQPAPLVFNQFCVNFVSRCSLFSPLGKLAGRAIYFTCVNFFLLFFLN